MLGIVSNQYGSRTNCQTCTKSYSQSTKSLLSITRALQHTKTTTMLRSKANPTRIGGFHTHPWYTYDSAPAPETAPAAAAPVAAAPVPVAAPVPAPGADEDALTGGGGKKTKKTKVATKKKKPPTKATCCKAKKPKTKSKKKKKSLGTMEGKYGKHFIRNLFDGSL